MSSTMYYCQKNNYNFPFNEKGLALAGLFFFKPLFKNLQVDYYVVHIMKTISTILALMFVLIILSCAQNPKNNKSATVFAIHKTDAEWKKVLSPIAYEVMVKRGTEPPFNNPYDKNYKSGIYVSAATGEPLFSSEDKYDSGTGWPSFTKPINPNSVKVIEEKGFGLSGDEVIEAKTGLHLGHVFNDGPKDKGGKRYCMNSAALRFVGK